MRLIDADEIVHEAAQGTYLASMLLPKNPRNTVLISLCKLFRDAINDAPTVDAVPVKHGEWIKEGRGYCRCSACNKEYEEEFLYYEKTKIAYCPFCGAKMDRGN